jgi:hypothetical protein
VGRDRLFAVGCVGEFADVEVRALATRLLSSFRFARHGSRPSTRPFRGNGRLTQAVGCGWPGRLVGAFRRFRVGATELSCLAQRRGRLCRIVEVLPHADDAFGTSRVRFEGGHEASVSSGAIYKGRCRRCQPAAAAPASTPLSHRAAAHRQTPIQPASSAPRARPDRSNP